MNWRQSSTPQFSQLSIVRFIPVALLMIMLVLTSCTRIPVDMNKAARGYWETVAGKVE